MSQDLDGGKQATVFVVAVGAYENLAPRPRVEEAARSLVDLRGASTHVRLEQPMIGGPEAGDLINRIRDWGSHVRQSERTGLLLWTGHADQDSDRYPQIHAFDRPVTPEEVAQALKDLEKWSNRARSSVSGGPTST